MVHSHGTGPVRFSQASATNADEAEKIIKQAGEAERFLSALDSDQLMGLAIAASLKTGAAEFQTPFGVAGMILGLNDTSRHELIEQVMQGYVDQGTIACDLNKIKDQEAEAANADWYVQAARIVAGYLIKCDEENKTPEEEAIQVLLWPYKQQINAAYREDRQKYLNDENPWDSLGEEGLDAARSGSPPPEPPEF